MEVVGAVGTKRLADSNVALESFGEEVMGKSSRDTCRDTLMEIIELVGGIGVPVARTPVWIEQVKQAEESRSLSRVDLSNGVRDTEANAELSVAVSLPAAAWRH